MNLLTDGWPNFQVFKISLKHEVCFIPAQLHIHVVSVMDRMDCVCTCARVTSALYLH